MSSVIVALDDTGTPFHGWRGEGPRRSLRRALILDPIGSCKEGAVPTELFSVDWEGFTLERLVAELRDDLSGPDADRMIFAFEEALRLARTDEELLPHLLAATAIPAVVRVMAAGYHPAAALTNYYWSRQPAPPRS